MALITSHLQSTAVVASAIIPISQPGKLRRKWPRCPLGHTYLGLFILIAALDFITAGVRSSQRSPQQC